LGGLVGTLTPVLVQAQMAKPAASPRSISDITAILDREKPDPAKAAQIRATADAAAPNTRAFS
jgi:hypothetical protein